MNISTYQTLTGIIVPTSETAIVTANITRTRRILESILGFTLDETLVNTNEYIESGITADDCPCPDNINLATLEAADSVVKAYRLFQFNKKDKYFTIDPCSAVHNVKYVYNNVTVRKFESDEWRNDSDRGIIRFLEKVGCCFDCCDDCNYVQLAVDATWLWDDEDNMPADLKYVWCDMIRFYSDSNNVDQVKSESLGTHSYTKTVIPPQDKPENLAILQKYAGPHGTINVMKVL